MHKLLFIYIYSRLIKVYTYFYCTISYWNNCTTSNLIPQQGAVSMKKTDIDKIIEQGKELLSKGKVNQAE